MSPVVWHVADTCACRFSLLWWILTRLLLYLALIAIVYCEYAVSLIMYILQHCTRHGVDREGCGICCKGDSGATELSQLSRKDQVSQLALEQFEHQGIVLCYSLYCTYCWTLCSLQDQRRSEAHSLCLTAGKHPCSGEQALGAGKGKRRGPVCIKQPHIPINACVNEPLYIHDTVYIVFL